MGSRGPVPTPAGVTLAAYAARLAQRAAEPEDELPLRLLEWRARDWYAARTQRPHGAAAQAQLDAAQAEHLVGVIEAVIGGLDLTPEQVHLGRSLAAKALHQVADEVPDWTGWPA